MLHQPPVPAHLGDNPDDDGFVIPPPGDGYIGPPVMTTAAQGPNPDCENEALSLILKREVDDGSSIRQGLVTLSKKP